jgi:hypothetical protein
MGLSSPFNVTPPATRDKLYRSPRLNNGVETPILLTFTLVNAILNS